ncbi:MAG TPA: hypothetical protein VFM55_18845 [Micromonosporaceae bacterium]|nr:hypothetical protein [Micromonosporaceae bacterium]
MATFVRVKNINPLGAVTVVLPDDGRRDVAAGEVIAVTPEQAGRPAQWRKPRDGDDLAFMEVRRGDDGEIAEVHDLGEGLLAQPDNWELVKPTADRKEND